MTSTPTASTTVGAEKVTLWLRPSGEWSVMTTSGKVVATRKRKRDARRVAKQKGYWIEET